MVSLKMFLFLAAVLLVNVSAHPNIDYTIHSIKPFYNDDVEIKEDSFKPMFDYDMDIVNDDIHVTEVDGMDLMSTYRAPKEKAVFAVKKVESGYARTTNVGLTVQKGTSAIIHFRIRLKAVTTEQLAVKAALFSKALTKAQKKELSKLTAEYDGGLSIPWLKFLNIDLNKKSTKKDFRAARAKTLRFDKLAILAKALLKEVVAQKIEVKGTLKARGISFIPTTVFSFIKLAKVHFEDASTLLVVSDHPGDVAAATKDGGKVVPSKVKEFDILGGKS